MNDISEYPEIRTVEMHSRRVLRLNKERNAWEVESEDVPVSEKLNAWCDANNANPVEAPAISLSQSVESPTRVSIFYVLGARVMDRKQQLDLEISLRIKTARLMDGLMRPEPLSDQPDHSAPPISPAVASPVDFARLPATTPAISPDNRAFVAPVPGALRRVR